MATTKQLTHPSEMLYDGRVGGSRFRENNMETRILIGVLLIAASFLIPPLLPFGVISSYIGAIFISLGVFLAVYDIAILGK